MAKNEISNTETTIAKIQQVADDTSIAKLHDMPQVTRAVTLARGMQQLRQLMSGEILDSFYSLMDTSLGYRTDRAPGSKDKAGNPIKPYPKEVVRDCVIEAMLRGANPVGNEFNIISSRCYLTKEFYERLVRELVHDLRVTEGVPTMSGGGALVAMRAEWVYQGRRDSLDCIKTADSDTRIPVRVNAGMGADAILGKAYRKLYAKIHRRVTGSTWLEEETGEVIDAPVSESVARLPEPEDEAEAADAEPNPLDGIQQSLESLVQIRDVDAYQATMVPMLKREEDEATLQEWCDWRREQIRASRGPRSAATE